MASNVCQSEFGSHAMHLYTEFFESDQLPRMSKTLQRKFDRASNFFRLEPWIEPMSLPAEIAKKHGLREKDRLRYEDNGKVMKDIESKNALWLLNGRSRIL